MILQARDIPVLREFKDEHGYVYVKLAYDKNDDSLFVMDDEGETTPFCGSHSVTLLPCKHQWEVIPLAADFRIRTCTRCGIKDNG